MQDSWKSLSWVTKAQKDERFDCSFRVSQTGLTVPPVPGSAASDTNKSVSVLLLRADSCSVMKAHR